MSNPLTQTVHWELEVIDTQGVSEYVQSHDTQKAAEDYGSALINRYDELTGFKVTRTNIDWGVV
tara:strand:+ start:102 stop:293 length:192 start_codon:yes stop_codon:yes gene_type:complete